MLQRYSPNKYNYIQDQILQHCLFSADSHKSVDDKQKNAKKPFPS